MRSTTTIVLLLLFIGYMYQSSREKKYEKKVGEELIRIKSLPNYGRVVHLKSKGRSYYAQVRRWEVPEAGEGIAELWCFEGPNPDGYTHYFLWEHDKLEFLD
jgi:hypothetical protein